MCRNESRGIKEGVTPYLRSCRTLNCFDGLNLHRSGLVQHQGPSLKFHLLYYNRYRRQILSWLARFASRSFLQRLKAAFLSFTLRFARIDFACPVWWYFLKPVNFTERPCQRARPAAKGWQMEIYHRLWGGNTYLLGDPVAITGTITIK